MLEISSTWVALLGLLAGGVTVWVQMNIKVAKMEQRTISLEKRASTTEGNYNKLSDEIKHGFEKIREEMRQDATEMKDYIKQMLDRK